MVRRRSLLLLPVILLGLCAWLGPPTARRPVVSPAGPTAGEADTPIVAVWGRPLAPYEEPLPEGARVRIGSTRYRHPNELDVWESTAVGPYILTIRGAEGRFTLTDAATGRRVWTETVDLGAGPTSYLSCAVSRDGRRLFVWPALSGGAATGRLWQVNPDPAQPLTPVATLQLPPEQAIGFSREATFTADGSELVFRVSDTILRYDAAAGGLRSIIPVQGRLLGLSTDGSRYFASDGGDPRIVLSLGGFGGRILTPQYRFRPRSAEPGPDRQRSLQGHTPEVPATEPITLTVGDARSGNVVAALTIPRQVGQPVQDLDLSPDGRHLSYGFRDEVVVLNVDRQEPVLRVRRPGLQYRWGTGGQFTADGQHLIMPDPDGRNRAFDLETGREAAGRFGSPQFRDYPGRPVRGDLVTDHGILARPNPQTSLPPGYARVVMAYCPDRQLIAVGDAAGRLDVWRPNGTRMAILRSGGKGVSAIGFSPDGGRLAACDRDRVVRVWAVGSWRETDRLEVPADHDHLCPECLTFSPDGRRLLVSQVCVMALWDFGSRQWAWDRPASQFGGRESPPVFFVDGRHLLTPDLIRVEASTGNYSGDFEHLSPVPFADFRNGSAFALSPDGRCLAVDRADGGLSVVDCTSGRVIRQFPERAGMSLRRGVLRFSPDGRRLVTCDDAGHAHVWEVVSGQLAFTLTYPDGAVHDVHFGADGRSLITANHREVIVWDLPAVPGAVADPWADLAHEAPKADRARRALLAHPPAAVNLLRTRLRPVAPVDPAAVARLVEELDAADYRKRERATAGLRAVGRRVLPLLREANPASEEGRARLSALVREIEAGPTADELRQVRAVEVLDQIGSLAAHRLMEEWATGDPGAVLTAEAGKARAPAR